MPLYAVTDERVLAMLANYGCKVEVDQGEGQCYYVTRLKDDGTGFKVSVQFGASYNDFETAANIAISAEAAKAAKVANESADVASEQS